MRKVALSILVAGLLAGCATEKSKQAAAPGAPDAASAEAALLNGPNGSLATRSVYYLFDTSVVQEADRPLVAAHGKYLSEHPEHSVRLEGNADERGSNEYNLALGQRRAEAVKTLLLAGGVKPGQITTESYGEEKPRLACHEETCWHENRRADLHYDAK